MKSIIMVLMIILFSSCASPIKKGEATKKVSKKEYSCEYVTTGIYDDMFCDYGFYDEMYDFEL